MIRYLQISPSSKISSDTLKPPEDSSQIPEDSGRLLDGPNKRRRLNPENGTGHVGPTVSVDTSSSVEGNASTLLKESKDSVKNAPWTRSQGATIPNGDKSHSSGDSAGASKDDKSKAHKYTSPENYEAVSYYWGSSEPDTDINVYTVGEGSPDILTNYTFKIRSNLYSGLRRLRFLEKPRYLWIDAICINQSDNNERNLQVSLMDKVYTEASSVCVWLGEAKDDSQLALNFISRVVNLDDFDRLVADRRTPHEWAALSKLMKRAWFSRRWVVQEIALAKSATLYCGDDRCDWSDFAVAVSLFEAVETDDRSISKTIQRSDEYNRVPDFLGEIQFLGATRLVSATSNLFRKSNQGKVLEKLLTLEALVSSLSQFQALKPHDTIYAVLALAKGVKSRAKQNKSQGSTLTVAQNIVATLNGLPSSPSRLLYDNDKLFATPIEREGPVWNATITDTSIIEPLMSRSNSSRRESVSSTGQELTEEEKQKRNHEILLKVQRRLKANADKNVFLIDYDKPFFDVCKEFLTFTIEDEGSMDIICRPWVPENGIPSRHHKPSWLVTTEKTAFGARPDKNYSRKYADTLVGAPGLGKRNYSASRATRATPGTPTTGWCFGEGAKAHSMYVEGFVIDVVEQKKPYAADGIILHEWLEAGEWIDESALPPDPFWRTLVADRGPNGSNPPTFYPRACEAARNQSVKGGHISTNALIHYGKSTIVARFARRVQEVVWMRRLIKTHRGQLGLSPEKTKKRDLICILYGCSVPVVLRKHHADEPEEFFEFIGECYVHGLMDGEAFTIQQNEKDKKVSAKRIFELR